MAMTRNTNVRDDLASAPSETVQGPFFRRVDWSAFWAACVATFAVYFYTLAPTVTLEDSGELAVAGDYLGVPHPPGYPIWTLISWIFSKVFAFVDYLGQPNPAWSIGLSSAVFGALAAGVTAMLICRSGSDILRQSPLLAHDMSSRAEDAICWSGGVVCSLLFAFSPVMWSQSVIVEVYSLNAFFLVLIFLLTYRWMSQPSDRLLAITAFVFGLGLTNYQVLLLAALPLAVVILLKDIDLFRDFLIVAIVFVVTVVIINLGSLPPMPGFPKHPPFNPRESIYTLINPRFYLGIFAAAATLVAMCFVIIRRRKAAASVWPMAVLGVAALALVWLLASVPSAVEIASPGRPAFAWGPYYLGFAVAMAALVALCLFIPHGRMVATALVTIEVTLAVLVRKGALLSLMHPSSLWFLFYVFLNFVILAIAFCLLPRGRTVALAILCAELGVAFYGFMPIVSDLRNPPMNWGYPRTWEGFKHALTRGQYEKISPADALSVAFIHQIGSYLTDLRMQFTLIAAPLGFLPFTAWAFRVGKRQIRGLSMAIGLAVPAVIFALLEKFLFPGVAALESVYKLLFLGVFLILAVGGLAILLEQGEDFARRVMGHRHEPPADRLTAALVLAGLALAFLGYCFMLGMKLIAVLAPLRASTAANVPVGLILLQAVGLILLIAVPLVVAALLVWLRRSRFEFRMDVDHHSQTWMIATLLGFLAMSVVLIVLANPKGDIQDNFIQRVKFISSHALYAFWIGYGLIFALAFVNNLFRNRTVVRWLGIGGAFLLPLIPLEQNAYNRELIRTCGGAEQNGHDFGWQFGNFQLRGASAIMEELSPDEEPLPNPHFPPEMGSRAVFFGGTDPGRFVPTYMIYSARVRDDVYLITQNALADSTYMSVLRDLYGNEIWIPAQDDSARSFQRYVEEVSSGRRPRNADLTIDGGRVQVSGALGVMEINGILAQMIFEHNSYRHDFYVEESYVIAWMYPYLTPHGLIMKINREPTPLEPATIRNDLDFWDWYTRRLVSRPAFLRDVVARKSFSKLRSSIGGLYANRGLFAEAEQAFRESWLLYPLSPEANFRLTQEVFIPQRRTDEAITLMRTFGEQDPGNTRTFEFVRYLENLKRSNRTIAEIEARRRDGKIEISDAMTLADLYLQTQQYEPFSRIVENILNTPNLSAPYYFRLAQMLDSVKQYAMMEEALGRAAERLPADTPANVFLEMAQFYAKAQNQQKMGEMLGRYLERNPADWRAWLDMAALHLSRNETTDATRALDQALRAGGSEVQSIISRDARFAPLLKAFAPRSLDRLGQPKVSPSTRR